MATAALTTPESTVIPSATVEVKRCGLSSWLELLIVPGLILLQLLLLGDPLPIHRSFWLDEIHTQLLIEDPSLSHAMTALAQGVDFNPPTYYLLAKGVSQFGVPTEIAQRSFSLVCVLVCCISVYALLRSRCSLVTATSATLLIWSLNVVQTQTFEARFYAPWLATAGVFGLCLQRCSQSPSRLWRVGLAVSSLLMCSIHYFGIISLGLMAAAFVVQNYRSRSGRWTDVLWMATGPVALAICVACFYQGQRSALTISTWVPALSWATFREFAVEALPTWAIGISIVACCGTWVMRNAFQASMTSNGDASEDALSLEPANGQPLLPAATALALMPVCLIVFSLVLQPALVARYATVGTIGFAVLMATLLRRCPTWFSAGIGIWLFIVGFQSLAAQYHYWERMETRQAEVIARLRKLDPQVPLIFESRHAMYPVIRYAPDLATRVHFLSLSDENLRDFQSATPFRIVERDVAQRIADYYPAYRTIPFDELHRFPRAYLFAFRQRKDFGRQLEHFEVTQRSPQLFEIVPRSIEAPAITGSPRNASHKRGRSDTVLE